MARLAVLASGNGSNFQALAEAIEARPLGAGPQHECALLIYDRKAAYAAQRAANLGIAARYVGYFNRDAEEAEAEIGTALDAARVDIVALAGFMRHLTPSFVEARMGRVVNVQPSLLPNWPGAHAIERAYEAGGREFGVTVHLVDAGMDTGPIVACESFQAEPEDSLSDIESKVHAIEHDLFPRAVLGLLDAVEGGRGNL